MRNKPQNWHDCFRENPVYIGHYDCWQKQLKVVSFHNWREKAASGAVSSRVLNVGHTKDVLSEEHVTYI